MRNLTLLDHWHGTRRDRLEPLRVLVVHDSLGARKQVERLLTRISDRLGADLRMTCDYQRVEQFRHREGEAKPQRIELIFLAAGCSATLPQEALAGITSLLPSLKASHGALALLSGTNVPRRLDVLLVEEFLRTYTQRLGVAFFCGCMPGLGCPGCGTPKPTKAGTSLATGYCVLHAPQDVEASSAPSPGLALPRRSRPSGFSRRGPSGFGRQPGLPAHRGGTASHRPKKPTTNHRTP
jgi:hypothetical protein